MGCWELISLPDHQKSEKHNILNKPMELPFISHQKSAMKAAIIERLLGFKTNAPDSAVRQTWPCPWRNGNGSHGGSWKVSRPNNQRILVLKGQRWLVVSSIFFMLTPKIGGRWTTIIDSYFSGWNHQSRQIASKVCYDLSWVCHESMRDQRKDSSLSRNKKRSHAYGKITRDGNSTFQDPKIP